ncbi:MAG: LamG-like jellyroll fold domain-containing protein [bacterium]
MQSILEKIRIKLTRYIYLVKYQFFTKKITIIKWQLNAFAITCILLGGFLVASIGVLPKLLALNETNFTIQQAGDSNFTLGTVTNVTATASNITLAKDPSWYSLNWNYKRQLTIKNTSASTLNANSSFTISVDTTSLESVLTNCNDLRVVYQNTTELPLTIRRELGSTGCNDSKVTNLTFPIQASLTTGSSDSTNYFLYYGNASASAQGSNGYSIPGGPTATLVCSFSGNSTCETGQTPTTETGAIRYSNKSALLLDGMNDSLTIPVAGSVGGLTAWTVEFWANSSTWNATSPADERIMTLGGSYLHRFGGLRWYLGFQGQGGLNPTIYQTSGYPSNNVWHHMAISYDGSNVRTFTDGTLINTAAFVGTPYSAGTTISFYGVSNKFQFELDELRVSNIARYTSSFTPQTSPFITDANTKSLYHFDENGDDPRNTGKAIDASGNGNNGTISGAKYVGGMVGIDGSSTDTGKFSNQSVASHSGGLVEEGTTNLITNPSFENASYNTNWSTNYMTYASGSSTFTPNISKRNSPGPFAAGPMSQGKYLSNETANGTDTISTTRGSQISGNFYQNLDTNQGSVVLWLTPEWNGNDGMNHNVFTDGSGVVDIFVSTNLTFFNNGAFIIGPSTTAWTAGSTYNIVVSWDVNNTIDGTNKVRFSVNGVNTYGTNAGMNNAAPGSNIYIGNQQGNYRSVDGIIEGLTVYRRVLYDGTYGTNVGNGNEISLIYNSGTGKDPTQITGSWDIVLAVPTNSTTGTLGTTGEAWSHPHSSNAIGNGGFMMGSSFASDGFSNLDGNGSLVFNGTTNNYVTISPNSAPIGANPWTAEAWANPDDNALAAWQSNVIAWGSHDASQRSARIQMVKGQVAFESYNGPGTSYTFGSPQVGIWHHIAASYDGTYVRLYVDGILRGTSGAGTLVLPSASLYIGGDGGLNRNFSGKVDDVRIWNYVRSQAEISANMNKELVGNEAGLVGYYKLNNEGGNTITDSSSGAHNGTKPAAVTWSQESPVLISNLATSERIFNGGYKWTNSVANQGMYKDIVTTAGTAFTIRALANSDGTSIPKIVFYDQTNGAEIGSMTGTNTSTKGSPNVLIFTGQAPAGCTSIRIKLINTQSSGTVYWHQVEVLGNILSNPSFEAGSGTPWVPTGWNNNGYLTGELTQDLSSKNSGSSSLKVINSSGFHYLRKNFSLTDLKYYDSGIWTSGTSRVGFGGNGGCGNGFMNYQNTSGTTIGLNPPSSGSGFTFGVMRFNGTGCPDWDISTSSGANFSMDDSYTYILNDVSLTVTPVSLANSTETSGVRVDGTDTLTQPVSNLSATSGVIKFKYTPRHNAADMLKFGNNQPYIIDVYGNATNYIRAYWSAANIITLDINDGNGDRFDSWDATGAIVAGTTYNFEISYSSTQILLKVDGVTKISMTQSATWWTSGGATGAVAAYAPTGAASLAASYTNLVNPGTNNATPQVAPTWDSVNGWKGNGTSVYMSTGLVPTENWSMIVRASGITAANYFALAGMANGGGIGNHGFYIATMNGSAYINDGYRNATALVPMPTSANFAISGDNVGGMNASYYNGAKVDAHARGYALGSGDIYILAMNNGSNVANSFGNQYIQSLAIFNTALTASQITSVIGAMNMVTPLSFSVVPTTAYFGSKQDGTGQADATFTNFTTLTPTLNTTSPFMKFGSNSAKLVNGGTIGDEYTTTINVGNTSAYTLSAYVFDGTTGNIGGVVNNTVAELFYNNNTVTTNYIDMGGGWWRLIGYITGVNANAVYGVQVKAGKTIYLDGTQLENKAYFTTYADGSLGSNYSWSGTANNSSSTRTGGTLAYSPTGVLNGTSGAFSFWINFPYWQTSSGGWLDVIASGNWTANNAVDLFINPSGNNVIFDYKSNGTANNGRVGTSKSLLGWHHIVGTWASNDQRLYIDNSLIGQDTSVDNNAVLSSPLRLGGPLGMTFSDLRVFNQSLSTAQVGDIYNQSLGIYSQSATNQAKYVTTGTWESPVINLNSNAAWGISPNFVSTETLNGNTVSYQVRTSPDASTWTSYTTNSGTSPNYSINALAQRYIQVKATLNSSTQITTPTVSGLSVHYVQDTTPPITNASNTTMKSNATGRDITKTTGWTNDQSPYFRWDLGADNVGGSGIKGYCLSLSQTLSDDPASQKGLLGTSPISTAGSNCQFIVGTNEIDFSNVNLRGNTWLSTSNNPYYLNIKAIDNTGNTYPTSETFDFLYDDIPPTNVTSFSTPQNSFASVDDIYFNWPISGAGIASDANSQLLGYQYSLNNETDWTGSDTSSSLGIDYIPINHTQPFYLTIARDSSHIQMGNNTIYFKAIDIAGNKSTISRSALISYGGDAPKFADGSSITVTPNVSTSNMYSVSWPNVVASPGRTFKSYYYMINTTPPNILSTILSNSNIYIPTTSTSIPEGKLVGAVKGQNTIYVVAIDDHNNYSAGNALSKTYTLDSTLPDPALNLRAADTSIKSVSLWSVSLAWEEPVYKGTGALKYEVDRSEDNINWTKVSETNGTAYVDTVPFSKRYYYRVGSMDNTDQSRANPSFSLSVSILPKGSYTVPAPLVSSPVTTGITTRRATVSFVTARSADSRLAFGIEPGKYFEAEISISTQTTTHVIPLASLLPSTTYYYVAKWTDEDGNIGTSAEQSFVTNPAPLTKDVSVKYVNTNSAQIQFTTKDASKVKIYYGKTTQFGGLQELPTSVNESKYTAILDNLEDGTKYYYRINTFDTEDTEYEGTVLDLTTLPRPKVSDVKLQQIKNTAETSILVTWTSNTEVTSIVTFYPETKINLSRDSVNINLQKGDHKMTLSGLLPDTTYNLLVKGVDRIGNEARSDVVKFTTATDTRAPSISEVSVEASPSDVTETVSGKKTTQIIVSWKTDEPATSRVEYGENTGDVYNYKTPEDNNLKTDHVVIISNLSASQIYHLRAISQDKAGNEAKSVDQVSITPNPNDNALDLIVKNFRNIFGF